MVYDFIFSYIISYHVSFHIYIFTFHVFPSMGYTILIFFFIPNGMFRTSTLSSPSLYDLARFLLLSADDSWPVLSFRVAILQDKKPAVKRVASDATLSPAASPEKRVREEEPEDTDPFTSLMNHSSSQGSTAGTKRVASLLDRPTLVMRPVSLT